MRSLLGTLLTLLSGCIAVVAVAFYFFIPERTAAVVAGIMAAIVWVAAVYIRPRERDRQAWRDDPPSEKQMEYARDLGIKFRRGITKGELSDMIDDALENQ